MIPRRARFAPLAAALALAACTADRSAARGPRDLADSAAAPAPPAAQGDTAAAADSTGNLVTVFEFIEAGGERVVTAAGITPDMNGTAEVSQHAKLIGSVGPFAFVQSSVYANTCGAHGNTSGAFTVVDLEHGRPAVLLDSTALATLAAQYREAAAAAFKADTATLEGVFKPDSARLTVLAPRFSGARLALDYQLTADACYVCSDDAWSSYTRSVRLPARELPPALRGFADTPLEVQAAFRMLHPDSGAGWSLIAMPAARRDALAHLFGVTAPAGGQEYLVWHAVPGGSFESAWLRGRGMEATIVGRRPGVWIAAGGRAWTWRTRTERVSVTTCAPPDTGQ